MSELKAQQKHQRHVETLLEEMRERQHLSRFDNLMFLSYPLMIALFSVLGNMLWNYESLGILTQVLQAGPFSVNLPYRTHVIVAVGFLVGLLVIAFLWFLRAYLTDSLVNRLVAFERLVVFGGLAALLLPIMLHFEIFTSMLGILRFSVTGVYDWALRPDLAWGPVVENGVQICILLLTIFASLLLIYWRTLLLTLRLAKWFESELPRMSARKMDNWAGQLPMAANSALRRGLICLTGLTTSYVALTAWVAKFLGLTTAFYGILGSTALIAVSLAVVVYDKVRVHSG